MVHGLEKDYAGRITFTRVNILNEDNQAIMDAYSFSATPEFYLVDGAGTILAAWDDSVTEAGLRAAFDAALGEDMQ